MKVISHPSTTIIYYKCIPSTTITRSPCTQNSTLSAESLFDCLCCCFHSYLSIIVFLLQGQSPGFLIIHYYKVKGNILDTHRGFNQINSKTAPRFIVNYWFFQIIIYVLGTTGSFHSHINDIACIAQ